MDTVTFENKYVQELLKKLKTKDGYVDEERCKRIIHQLANEEAVAPLRDKIRKKYTDLLKEKSIPECPKFLENMVSFFPDALHKACYEIETDLRILFSRRKNLIGIDEKTGISLISMGKIAGITTYRLAKAHIIHLNPQCIDCCQDIIVKSGKPCSISTLNAELAIICGFFFIGKDYTEIREDIRNEILYTLIYRHTNQETLGIIFDTLKLT